MVYDRLCRHVLWFRFTSLQTYLTSAYLNLYLEYLLMPETHTSLSCYVPLPYLVTGDRNLVFVYLLSDCVRGNV